jgi:endonuclease/exonuclease/phosphatase family metal-dependent hydrolase
MKRIGFVLAALGISWGLSALDAYATPFVYVESPRTGASVESGFAVRGIALDLASVSGSGVSEVQVWAHRASGTPIFLARTAGGVARPDVAAVLGPRFGNSGFEAATAALPAGVYYLGFYPVSSATGTFDLSGMAIVPVTVAAPPPTSGTLLKVLTWNTHHGTDVDEVCSLDRIVPWIVQSGASVVMLNEVELKTSWWCGGEDQPARYKALLQAQTGKTWYANFAQRDGLATGQGNMVLSTYPIEQSEDYLLSYSRSVARAQILVNGVRVNVFSTHLDHETTAKRTTQIAELLSWMGTYPEQRIVAGDFNAWPGASELAPVLASHADAWAVAKANGTAVSYPGNESGITCTARIDYVFLSRGATRLSVKGARVFNTADASGMFPSDHLPVLATVEVR